MIICSRCGAEATSYDRFCKKCGRRLDVRDAEFALAEPAPAYVPPSGSGWTDPLAGTSGSLASGDGAAGTTDATRASEPADTKAANPADASASAMSVTAASIATMTATNASMAGASAADSADGSIADASTVTLPVSSSMASAVARLLVRPLGSSTPAEVREYALDGQNVALGRSPSCDIVLERDPLISRRHALLRYDGERYTIVDLGSSNGTFVNDSELTEAHPLAEGDRIQVGEYELTYATGPASPSASWTGAHNSALITGHGPVPKTEPHLAALPLIGALPQPGEDGSLAVPDPAEPTIPKSDLAATSAATASAPDASVESASGGCAGAVAEDEDEDEAPTVTPAPATVSDLEALRNQIASMMTTAETLARRANEADQQAEQRRTALIEARERLTGLISELQRITSDPEDGEDLTPLLRIVRQAADNPRHVDHMMQLADSAGDILSALEARQARTTAPAETLNALNALHAWLARVD